ncbi:unnamed protein product [Heligmosomoides polygyrus]|uniref:Transposase n=1 Tax=Heligmosomoides polygyrus TaxID=6339 RepID=A0A183GEV2_HELPZ|nr:unnamed protein product [Heligmosomoides polygyrus]
MSWTASRRWTDHKLTWLGDSRDHQGVNPIVRPLHCTLAWADLCGSFSLSVDVSLSDNDVSACPPGLRHAVGRPPGAGRLINLPGWGTLAISKAGTP